MKSKTIVFAALLIAAVMALLAPRQAKAGVTFSYFYDSLIPYGDWVDVDQYGYCWAPRGMAADWRPYTDGYWTYTDAGWTWVSYEDFGSITYHYGRWVRLEDVGWVWKPDYRWGPAWVSWRQSDNYMGWAPLPPDVAFNEDNGVGVWVDRDYDIGPSSYVFCETRYFGAPVMRNVCVPVRRNVDILNVTVNITNITVINSHDHGRLVYCGGPDYRWLAARSERPINRLELVLRTDGDWVHRRRPELSRSVGAQLFVDAPVIEPMHERFAPPRVAREIRAPRIDRGWGIVADPGMRDRIHQRYQEQTRGLTAQTAPAYRVNEAEVRNFVREARPAPSGAPGVVQTMQSNVQRAPQQPQQTLQQNVPQVQPALQPSAQPSQSPRRMRGGAQQQPVQTQPGMQPAIAPQTTQPVQPSAQPSQSPRRMRGGAQQQQPVQTQPGMQPAVAPQTMPAAQPSAQPTQSPRRMHGKGQQPGQDQPAAQPQATQVPQRVQPSVQSVQTPKAAVAPAQAAPQTQRTPSEQQQRQAEQQQRQAAESARNAQRQQQEQQQRQAAENARNAQRQQQEQQQRQAAESARNAQRQQQEQQQRQAAESARNAQRQQQEQQQRQAAESARNAQRQQQEQQQRQAAESARNAQRQQQEQLQRRESVAPQAAPQAQQNRDKNKDPKKHERDRLNDPNSVQ